MDFLKKKYFFYNFFSLKTDFSDYLKSISLIICKILNSHNNLTLKK